MPNLYTIDYTITSVELFDLDLEKLVDLLIYDRSEDNSDPGSAYDIITYFGDNVMYYLWELGFPRDIKLGNDAIDYIYDDIYDRLKDIIDKKLNK